MIVLNKQQSEWMKKNFMLSKNDMPTDFWDAKEFIEIICGFQIYRGDDYLGDCHSFLENCYLSLTIRGSNKDKFNRMFLQLHNHWIPEAKKFEYYELLENLFEINRQFIKLVQWHNSEYIDDQLNSLFQELNIKTEL